MNENLTNETPIKELKLNWTLLKPIAEISLNDAKRGVYKWGFKIDNKFIDYYVGIAENIQFRLYEHLNCLIGGKYSIFHKDCLKDFKTYKKSAVNETCSDGRIYEPFWPTKYQDFLSKRNKLQPHIDFMVDNLWFQYAEIKIENNNNFDLREIEKLVINEIKIENLINSRSGFSNHFKISHVEADII